MSSPGASRRAPRPCSDSRSVIDNRPGAGGTTGTAAVAKARRDGYTMVFGSSSTHVTGPYLITPAPYDPLEDSRC